ncbi:hypothetical protein BH24CHL5_BH24CHL5_11470 [soil metagenome]
MRASLLGLIAALVVLAAACTPPAAGPLCAVGGLITECGAATGIVIAVDGPGAAQVERFSLRTDQGEQIEFSVGRLDLREGGLPAPHLREHLVSGVPITVEYKIDDGRHVALRYVDA